MYLEKGHIDAVPAREQYRAMRTIAKIDMLANHTVPGNVGIAMNTYQIAG